MEILPFGRSVYLSHEALIHALPPADGAPIFLSLHISEEFSDDYCDRAKKACLELADKGYRIIADVSVRTMEKFGETDLSALARKLRIHCLRVDYGLSKEQICDLARKMPIAINASTVSSSDAALFAQAGKELFAIHNFYPRPETGLDDLQFSRKTGQLQALGYRVYAFIPGDSLLRGPVGEGLPTLEQHRGLPPSVCYIQLCLQALCDGVIVGDPGLSQSEQQKIDSFRQTGVISLPCCLDERFSHLRNTVFSSREDSPSTLIRIRQSRTYASQGAQVAPENCTERERGCVTLDNSLYGRYSGEMMITRRDFPADKRVNVIGKIADGYLPLLDLIDENTPFQFV